MFYLACLVAGIPAAVPSGPRDHNQTEDRGAVSIVNDSLPALQITTLDGTRVDLHDLLGDDITVVNLWATWCLPCRDEIPDLNLFFRRYAESGVSVIGIAVESGDADRVTSWLEPFDVQYPIGFGVTGQQMIDEFRAPGLPFTLIVDSGGRILQAMYGQQTLARLERAVEPLLADVVP